MAFNHSDPSLPPSLPPTLPYRCSPVDESYVLSILMLGPAPTKEGKGEEDEGGREDGVAVVTRVGGGGGRARGVGLVLVLVLVGGGMLGVVGMVVLLLALLLLVLLLPLPVLLLPLPVLLLLQLVLLLLVLLSEDASLSSASILPLVGGGDGRALLT